VPGVPFWLVTVGVPWQPTEMALCPANLKAGFPVVAFRDNIHACRGAPVWQKLFIVSQIVGPVGVDILDVSAFQRVTAYATVE